MAHCENGESALCSTPHYDILPPDLRRKLTPSVPVDGKFIHHVRGWKLPTLTPDADTLCLQ